MLTADPPVQRLRELERRRAALRERRDELLEQLREANEAIGWLHAERRVLTRPPPRRGFLAWLFA